MCCCLFWIVYFRHLAVLVCELMGVQSIWLFSPCSPFSSNPPLICMDPSVKAERRALKTERQKFPRQPLQIILFSVIILKEEHRSTNRRSLFCSSSCRWLKKLLLSFLCKEWVRKWMTSEGKSWVAHPRFRLKVTLQSSVVQRCFYYSSFNLRVFFFIIFMFSFISPSPSLKLNDKLWNFVVFLFLMWVLKNDNLPSACDGALPPPAPSSLPISCCGSSSCLTTPSFQNMLVSVLRPSLSPLAAVCFAVWSVFVG